MCWPTSSFAVLKGVWAVNPECITPEQLQRLAMLYIRQSSMRQVKENTESARRQYGLSDRLIDYGWPRERIMVIDGDTGQSGAFAEGREGFQKLVAEVGMGHVGVVAALEVSRLSRDNADWAQLVKICALTHTLVMDEHGLYDPRDVNEGLLLDIKGDIAKAEWRLIIQRCQGAIINRAKRGEFRMRLPVGFVYDALKHPVLDPDIHVQEAIRHFFTTFRRIGSARATVGAIRAEGLKFPIRGHEGPHAHELRWEDLTYYRAITMLHNPRYAGIYCYGRRTGQRTVRGTYVQSFVPREKWVSFLPGTHPGYITPEEFEQNQKALADGCHRITGKVRGPPREGPALLQGMVVCGFCGRRMTVQYKERKDGSILPIYFCPGGHLLPGPVCQSMRGDGIDEAVSNLLLEVVTPMTRDAALQVHRELQKREEEADRLRRLAVDRARREAELSHRQYLHVDPENRMVAASLEKDWNEKLQVLAHAQSDYEAACAKARQEVSAEQQEALMALTRDFPSVWKDPRTPWREKKRMARMIIEDVTLVKGPQVAIHVRFKGGTTRTLSVVLPRSWSSNHRTPYEVVDAIRTIGSGKTDAEIARILNDGGYKTGGSLPFDAERVGYICRTYGLRDPLPVPNLPSQPITTSQANVSVPVKNSKPDHPLTLTGAV